MGYSIGCRPSRGGGRYHASVRLHRETVAQLKARFSCLAVHRSVEELRRHLRALPYEPYAPVRDQLRGVQREINRRRKTAGLELLPWDALRRRRAPVKPFGETTDGEGVLSDKERVRV